MESSEALTIGEVINLLKEDFPDVSVSKVRFLESQGLLSPGRTVGTGSSTPMTSTDSGSSWHSSATISSP